MEFQLFYQITGVLVLAGLIAVVVSFLRQPSVIAFILTGLVVGPLGYMQMHHDTLDALGQIGIALLLFMVGLELDIKHMKRLGKTAVISGLVHMVFSCALGFFISLALGFSPVSAAYIAVALTFSSTIVVVKLLSEKKDAQSLYGRIAVGFLVVQDFAALGILLFLGGSSGHGDIFSSLPGWQYVVAAVAKVLIIILSLIYFSKKIFPRFINRFGQSDELLTIFSLAWALGLSAFMSLPAVGFSLEVGGFIAGLALANSQVHYEISARIKYLRDFFLILFFIVFGSKLVFGGVVSMLLPALLLSAFVLVVQPLIMMFVMGYLGYTPRTSFFVAVTTAQVSEFSFVVVALGSRLGVISDQVLGLVTLVGIITIAVSSYMILYTKPLYSALYGILKHFDFKHGAAEKQFKGEELKNHVILVGANRLASRFLHLLDKSREAIVIVDFDPNVVSRHEAQGFRSVCGDIADPYIQEQVCLNTSKLVISSVPDLDDNLTLINAIQNSGSEKKPKTIFLAQNDFESKYLYELGVDYVLSPHFISGMHLAKILEDKLFFKTLIKLKKGHLDAIL
ncbi:MAG: cation:proton antiporter [Candidatus Doudnabacteria bacterium]|nr:cation:proton antiporter [Candidatus Doudnabacteria bacterium]